MNQIPQDDPLFDFLTPESDQDESPEQDVSTLLAVSKRALKALRFAARSEFLTTLVRDLDQAIQNVEPWLDQTTDDPIQNGWVDHRGRP